MKFSEYQYERPNIEEISKEALKIIESLKKENNLQKVITLINEYNKIKNKYYTLSTLASIRNSIDTTDEFYEKEIEFLNEEGPKVESVNNQFVKVLVNHSLKKDLINVYGDHWFNVMENSLKVFDDCIMEELVEESKLSTAYSKLLASAKIEFDGKINNLSQMGKYAQSTDRAVRKEAALKTNEFFEQHEDEIDDIYDKLVNVRNRMAVKLGYKNFVDFGYARLGRTDYNSSMVENYRKQVYETLVPLCSELVREQMKRIKIDHPQFYDLSLSFLDGNPEPKGDKDYLVDCAHKMYSEMSPETKEFFEFMMENELLDLEAKPGKAGGGYCTYINDYKAPFIFSNFNGTKGDIDVLTHEAGHAFQVYSSAKVCSNPDLIWPTYEACEIHSMSMEFFAYPWLELFLKEDVNKYKNVHLTGALTFIPYGVCVDEFQHFVYENPTATKEERKTKWRELEQKYLPYKDYSECEFLNKGTYWFRQGHIFGSPFYYIDYTLAQVCALEFYLNSLDDAKKAWSQYVALCKLGGTKSFLNLIQTVGIHNPFVDGTIAEIVQRIMPIIKSVQL